MDNSKFFLFCRQRQILAFATVILAVVLTANVNAAPTKIYSVPLIKADQSRPATKLEIITAVKKRFKGRILSIRRGYEAFGMDCHNIRLIDKTGELLHIRTGCN